MSGDRMVRTARRMLAGLAFAIAGGACAATTDVTPGGFRVALRVETAVSAERVHEALAHPERWWSSRHTWSGSAANLSLVPDASGCFCERWNGNAVEHGRVVFVARGQVLRLSAALGPLQALGVNGVLTYATTSKEGRTTLETTYRVSGDPSAQLDRLATAVDGVLDEQVRRLVRYLETGAPE